MSNQKRHIFRGSIHRRAVAAAALVCAFLAVATIAFAQPLSVEDRVRAQEAIERVYYNHRIWPKENPGPKRRSKRWFQGPSLRLR